MKRETYQQVNTACTALENAAQEVLRENAEILATNDHIAIIKHLYHTRLIVERLRSAKKQLDELEKQLSHEAVPDAMRAHEVRTVTVEGIGRVSLSNRWSCSILDKPEAFKYLRDTGNGALIIETVNAQTLAAFARELNEEKGTELPEHLFKTSVMTTTSITKG